MKESDCKVTDPNMHLQRALTCYGRTEKDMVTVDEDKDAGTYVEEEDDVEHVTAILKNSYRYEIY